MFKLLDVKIYGYCLEKFLNKSEEMCQDTCGNSFRSTVDALLDFNFTVFNDAQLISINKTFVEACEYDVFVFYLLAQFLHICQV